MAGSEMVLGIVVAYALFSVPLLLQHLSDGRLA